MRIASKQFARTPRCSRRGLVVIGASAGGPSALLGILKTLSADFPTPMVIVQHMGRHSAQSLAQWLNSQSALEVRPAQRGELPRPGRVLVAGDGDHLVLTAAGRLSYTEQPRGCSYRPSIDVFFNSVTRFWTGPVIGVLLTGMGRDGAEGLRTLRAHGHHTIAQDQVTSAVYGMPKAAVELDAVVEILPLHGIGPRLTALAMSATLHA